MIQITANLLNRHVLCEIVSLAALQNSPFSTIFNMNYRPFLDSS